MKTKVLIGVVALVVLAFLFTEGVLIPKQLQPSALPIRLLSVVEARTDSIATFELRNESSAPVDVWPQAMLNVGPKVGYHTTEVSIPPTTIESGRTATLPISVPRDQDWQVMFRVARHKSQVGTIVYSEWSTDLAGEAPSQ